MIELIGEGWRACGRLCKLCLVPRRSPVIPLAASRCAQEESLGDKAKNAFEDAKDAVKDAAGNVKEAVVGAADDAEGAAKVCRCR